jgi:hypothetical protein
MSEEESELIDKILRAVQGERDLAAEESRSLAHALDLNAFGVSGLVSVIIEADDLASKPARANSALRPGDITLVTTDLRGGAHTYNLEN